MAKGSVIFWTLILMTSDMPIVNWQKRCTRFRCPVYRRNRANVAAWMVDMERFFELVVFNYIYANGDAHLKNFALLKHPEGYRLSPAYDLLNTALHVDGDDFVLDGGLSPDIEKTDAYANTGHPCRVDFERFACNIGLLPSRTKRILDKYATLSTDANTLIGNSFLNEKMKRSYLRIVKERISRFNRISD